MVRVEPETPVVARATRLSVVYLPPSCSIVPAMIERQVKVILGHDATPMVAIVPPAKALDGSPDRAGDRVILALDAGALDSHGVAYGEQVVCDPYLYAIGQAMRCGFRVGRSPPEAYLDSLVPALAEHLTQFYPIRLRKRESRGLSPARLVRVLALIEERLDERIPLEAMAQAAHLSPYHFARMFRRSTGASPHAYLTARRLARAKELLATTVLSVHDIAVRVGYRNQAHFSRAFQVHEGLPPRRYRMRTKNA